jgi:hypothetical protein
MDAVAAPSQFGMGRVITRTFEVFGRNFIPFSALAALAVAPTTVFGFVLTRSYVRAVTGPPNLSVLFANIPLQGANLLVSVVLSVFLQAALVHGTFTALNGRPASFGECLSTALRSFPRLLGIGFLASFGVIFGMLLLVVPGLILAVMWSVVVPACIVEHKSVGESFSRSSQLTSGHRWAIFGLIVILAVADFAAGLAIRPLSGLSFFPTPGHVLPEFGIYWILGTALRIIIAAISAIGAASIYYELRSIKEGVGAEELASVFS